MVVAAAVATVCVVHPHAEQLRYVSLPSSPEHRLLHASNLGSRAVDADTTILGDGLLDGSPGQQRGPTTAFQLLLSPRSELALVLERDQDAAHIP